MLFGTNYQEKNVSTGVNAISPKRAVFCGAFFDGNRLWKNRYQPYVLPLSRVPGRITNLMIAAASARIILFVGRNVPAESLPVMTPALTIRDISPVETGTVAIVNT